MKTKLIKRVPNMVAILAFLALLAGNAFAFENSSRIVSPYWQSDSGSYSFIAVSHTSLSGMASQIGMTINAISSDQSAFGTAVTFTIDAGTTQRIFIHRTGHSTVNSTTIPTGNFITGTTNFSHGHIRIDPIATSPTTTTTNATRIGTGDGLPRCNDVVFLGCGNCRVKHNRFRYGVHWRYARFSCSRNLKLC